MFDEEGFQRAIDADPTNATIRMVFADWLEEQGDPRAEGYRELARLNRVPVTGGQEWNWPGYCSEVFSDWGGAESVTHRQSAQIAAIPREWIEAHKEENERMKDGAAGWIVGETRREADDKAAIAYLAYKATLAVEAKS